VQISLDAVVRRIVIVVKRLRTFIHTAAGSALVEGLLAAVCAILAGALYEWGGNLSTFYVLLGITVAWVLISVAVPYWLRSTVNTVYAVRESGGVKKNRLIVLTIGSHFLFLLGCALFVHGYMGSQI
jgi:hypothetical protein